MNQEAPVIHYYRPGEVRAIRDADRRAYRRGVVMLFAYVVIVCIPVRIAFDVAVSQPAFGVEFLKPFGPGIMAGLAILMLAAGLRNVFKRRG